MNRRLARMIAAGICLAAVATVALYRQSTFEAAPREDLQALAHWVFDGAGVKDGRVVDRAGDLPGVIQGKPKLISKPTQAIELTEPNELIVVKQKVASSDLYLPRKETTVAAWVRLDDTTEWGGIFSCIQDNGSKEAGIILGYNKSNFYFGLASKKTEGKDQFGNITYLEAKSRYQLGRWYHVAGTYDGTTQRIYVNGKLEAESKDQAGDILYAPTAPLVLGRYRDSDEDYPMQGAIREIIWSSKAATAQQIAAHFEADAALAAAQAEEAPRFVIEPYLQFVTRNSITVMCETPVPTSCEVLYDTKFPPEKVAKSKENDVVHEIPLTNLLPKTKYYYRMICTDGEGKKYAGKAGTFQTAGDPTDAYSFAVIGDTQRNPVITGKVSKLMWERRPNFVLHMGDVVDDGADKKQWTGDLFKPCQELFSRVVRFPCIGNHEKNHAHYYKYFSLPKPEYYYSFKYGNAEFFVLDTNKPVDPESEQYKWVDKALAASQATWKICYHHHPLYSSDSYDYGNTERTSSTYGAPKHKALLPLFEKHNVDLVLNGHIHAYERTHPIRDGKVDAKKGVVHITSGGGGGKLEGFEPTASFFKNQQRVDFHYCYYTVHLGVLTCHVFDHEGRLFDQFTMKKD